MSMDDNQERYEEEAVSLVPDDDDDQSQVGSVCNGLCFDEGDEVSTDEESTLEDKTFIASDDSCDTSEDDEYLPCDEEAETDTTTSSEDDSDGHILDDGL